MKKYFNNVFWRWHFYAGIFITPLLITLSVTGILYLFYPEIENQLNHDAYFGQTHQPMQSVEKGLHDIEQKYPGWHVMKVSFLKDDYNTRVSLMGPDDGSKLVFLDHHNHIQAAVNPQSLFSNITRELHSSLLTGNTFINDLVELAACWAIFLIVTGVFMTLFRRYLSQPHSKIRRKNQAKMHAVLGTILAVPLLALILTGLPWSGYMGDKIYNFAVHNSWVGFPEAAAEPPVSNDEIPWATRQEHTQSKGSGQRQSITAIIAAAKEHGFKKPYNITVPMDNKGTYVLSTSSSSGVTGLDVSPFKERTVHLDQYTAMPLAIYDFKDYGPLAKFIAVGIPLHEGHLFGWVNKILNLVVTTCILILAFLGIRIYFMRKAPKKLSAPRAQSYQQYTWFFAALLIIMGIMMPLFGLSLIVVAVIELILSMTKRKNITA